MHYRLIEFPQIFGQSVYNSACWNTIEEVAQTCIKQFSYHLSVNISALIVESCYENRVTSQKEENNCKETQTCKKIESVL